MVSIFIIGICLIAYALIGLIYFSHHSSSLRERLFRWRTAGSVACLVTYYYWLWQFDLLAANIVNYVSEWDIWFAIVPTTFYYNFCMGFLLFMPLLGWLCWVIPHWKK